MTTLSADQSYFERIQRFFTEVTGCAVLLSGRDLELLEQWREAGVPPSAVCKGLRDAAEAMPDDDPPRDVHACRKWIEPYVERAATRAVGSDDDSSSTDDSPTGGQQDGVSPLLDRALDRVERAGRRADRESVREVYREAWRRLRDARREGDAEPYEALSAVEAALVDGYFRALDRQEQEALEERIASQNRELLERMSPEARREHLRARRRRLLMREYDLVSLLD